MHFFFPPKKKNPRRKTFWSSVETKKRGKEQCPKTGTTPGSNMKVPSMDQKKQLGGGGGGYNPKYECKAAITGPIIKHIASEVKCFVRRGLGVDT